MKRILLAILVASGIAIIGGIIDTSNIFGQANQLVIITGTCIVAGMVLGVASVYEFKDVQSRKKELLT